MLSTEVCTTPSIYFQYNKAPAQTPLQNPTLLAGSLLPRIVSFRDTRLPMIPITGRFQFDARWFSREVVVVVVIVDL